MARGHGQRLLFLDDRDRRCFIKILAEACEKYGVRANAQCQMGTHYHIVVQTPRANISEFMGFVNGEFAKYWNRRYHCSGHVYNERYKPVLVDTGLYLRVLMSYVLNNPVAGGIVSRAADWPWSSYRATAGLETPPGYLSLDWLETTFPASSMSASQAMFERYVNAPSLEEAEYDFTRAIYGGDDFKERIRAHIAATLYTASIPRAYRALHRPPLQELLSSTFDKEQRNTAILRAHVVYAYTSAEIGRCLHLHPASVSRVICSVRERLIESIAEAGTFSTKR
jgi:REP element-mobilizing transposase RayT